MVVGVGDRVDELDPGSRTKLEPHLGRGVDQQVAGRGLDQTLDRIRLFRESGERQTSQSQPMTGTPVDVPLPRTVNRRGFEADKSTTKAPTSSTLACKKRPGPIGPRPPDCTKVGGPRRPGCRTIRGAYWKPPPFVGVGWAAVSSSTCRFSLRASINC